MSNSRTFRKHQQNQPPRQSQLGPHLAKRSPWRWPIIVLCIAASFAGTWALFEYVIWRKVPPELVGKWVVTDGPQEGATFDFSWTGKMVGKVNIGGREGIIDASVRVDGKNLYWTTYSKSGQEDTKLKVIRTLTANQLIIEDEQGLVLRMERAN